VYLTQGGDVKFVVEDAGENAGEDADVAADKASEYALWSRVSTANEELFKRLAR
jgi:hypothetical protein